MSEESAPKTPPVNTRQSLNNGILISGVLLVTAVVGLALFLVFRNVVKAPSNPANSVYEGTVIDPPLQLPDFTLTDQNGKSAHLSDLRGRAVLLFFGYTHCPDICPATLNEYKKIHTLLGDQAAKVAFVFISTDGKRDTPDVIAKYLNVRGVADFVTGLTGDEAAVHQVGKDFGVDFSVNSDSPQDNYLIDHTAATFLIDAQGQLRRLYSPDPEQGFALNPDAIVQHIKAL